MASIRAEVTSGRMPKNRIPLTANEKEFFIRWMDLGAPRESEMKNPIPLPGPDPAPIPVPSPPPPPPIEESKPELDKPDYQLVRTQIIVPRCLGCHSDAGKNKGGVNLETYQNIYELKDLIKEEIESNSMPKPTTRPLTVAQKQMLLLWLDIGAPEKNLNKMSEE
jgi:hypothetical protein